jgi:hypothetical protein
MAYVRLKEQLCLSKANKTFVQVEYTIAKKLFLTLIFTF